MLIFQRLRLRGGLAGAAAVTLGLRVTALLAAFGTSVLLARTLGADGYGTYVYATAWASLLAIPSMFGLDTLLTRDIASYSALGRWSLAKGLLRYAFSLGFGASLLAAGCAALVAFALLAPGDPRLVPLLVGMALIPLLAMTRLAEAAVRGFHHLVVGQFPEYLLKPALLIGLLLLVFLGLERRSASIAVLVNVGAAGVALLVGLWILRERIPGDVGAAHRSMEASRWLASALPLFLIGSVRVINSETDVIMLGTLTGPAAAGVYRVAGRGADLISFVLAAVNFAVAPTFASLHARGEVARLQQLVTRSAQFVLAFSLPVAVLLVVFGKQFMGLFGGEFVSGAPVLIVLSVGQLLNAAAGSVGLALMMTGHERSAAAGLSVAAVVNVILNAVLIPLYGAIGAAIATATSTVIWNAILIVEVYRRLGIASTAFGGLTWRRR